MTTATSTAVVQPSAPPSYEDVLNNFHVPPVLPPPTYEEAAIFTVNDDAYRRDGSESLTHNRVQPELHTSTSSETSQHRTCEDQQPQGDRPKLCLPPVSKSIACFSVLCNVISYAITIYNTEMATEAFNKGDVSLYRFHAVLAWTFFILTFATPIVNVVLIITLT